MEALALLEMPAVVRMVMLCAEDSRALAIADAGSGLHQLVGLRAALMGTLPGHE